MNRRKGYIVCLIGCLLVGLVAAPPAAADVLMLKDGRILEGRPMEHAEGGVRVHFENGDVFVPSDLIHEAVLESAPPYEPKTEEEREKVERGLVLFEGDWVSEDRRASLIKKRVEERKAEIDEIREHALWRNRYKDDTKHFEFEYTVPPHIFEPYRDAMEAYFKEFCKTWKVRQPRDLGKLTVCFYTSLEAFHQIGGVRGGVRGYFRFVKPLELNFYYDRLDTEFTSQVMFHETNHYLQLLLNPEFSMPHFPGESLAEYYGGSEFDPDTGKLTVGLIQEGRLTEIQNDIAGGEMMDLAKLIKTEGMYEHYTWGWALAHFLMSDRAYGKKFEKFIQTLTKGRGVNRVDRGGGMMTVTGDEVLNVFMDAMGLKDEEDLKELEAEWHAYVNENLKLITSSGLEKAAAAAMNSGRPIRAKRLFNEAIEKGTQTALTYHRFGELLARDNDLSPAIGHFRKAIELDPLAGQFYASLGRALIRKDEKEEGMRYVNLARELAPDDPWLQLELEDIIKAAR